MKKLLLSVATLVAATGSYAAEYTGGELRFDYTQLTSKQNGKTLNNFAVDAAMELGFTKAYAAQVDLGLNEFGGANLSGRNMVLHGILHSSETLSFGVFFGQDKLEAAKREFVGAEIGFEVGNFDAEGYYLGNVDDGYFSVLGLTGNYALAGDWALTGGYEHANIRNDNKLSRYSIGVRYNVAPTVALTADLGNRRAESRTATDNETYIGLGAEFTFGAQRGATFGKRGVFHLFTGL